jgi:hypothetical protein
MTSKRTLTTAAVALVLALALSACQSTHEKGVNSNYLSQWTKVDADVKKTTKAAEWALNDAGLRDVNAVSTNVDGTATAKKADGTKVNVSIKKEKENSSEVSVTVGKMGEPSLGAELARKIKDRAEGRS